MIAPRNNINSLSHYWIVSIMNCIVDQDRICTFSGLPLHIVHVTATENDDLVGIGYS